jgi:hypothetical protein
MAANGAYSINIKATDNATKVFKNLNKSMMQAQAPAKRLAKEMSRFGELSGLNKVRDGLGNLGRTALNTASAVSKIIAPLGTLTGAASLAGLYRATAGFADWSNQLTNTARRLGMTNTQLQSYQNAAKLAGVSSDNMTAGLKALADTMQGAINGSNVEAAQAFQLLHIQIKRTASGAIDLKDALPQAIDALRAIKNPTQQAALAAMIFQGASESMLPIINQGSEALDRNRKLTEKYGLINTEGAKNLEDFRFSQAKMTLAVEGFGMSISERAAPAASKLLDFLSDLIATNRDAVASKFGEWIDRFSKWIEGINWHSVGDGIDHWIDKVSKLIDTFGGLENVCKDLFELWLVGKGVSAAASVVAFGANIAGIVAATRGLSLLGKGAAAAEGVASGAGEAVAGGTALGGAVSAILPFVPVIAAATMVYLGNKAAENGSGKVLEDYNQRRRISADSATAAPSGANTAAMAPTSSFDETWNRMINQESGGKQFGADGKPLTSSAGAIGVAQVMPATARETALKNGIAWDENKYKTDADYNKNLGHLYYQELSQKYKTPMLTAGAYNAGPGKMDEMLGALGDPRKGEISEADFMNSFPITETRDYMRKVAPPGSRNQLVPQTGDAWKAPTSGALPFTGANTPGGVSGGSDSTVHVQVDLNGAPPGTTANVKSKGNVTTGAPRVSAPLPFGPSP